ncbi:MAG: HPr family phosphocarrier protein [Desulfamplus sp.]|nr:HPr family phosphocarrier protein [Desulfamplus sp.]MBF0412659.1 HPr family phosphocarrier protein [Desulfamplus sp.]
MIALNNKIRKVIIKNGLGLHARPASMIAKITQNAENAVWLNDGNNRADASSVIDILTINGKKGKTLVLEVESERDIHLLETLADFFQSGFGENTDG